MTAEDRIKQLLIAFDDVPYKGLYFWLSLLLPAEIHYENILKNAFAGATQTQDNKKIKEIETLLKQMRTEVLAKKAA